MPATREAVAGLVAPTGRPAVQRDAFLFSLIVRRGADDRIATAQIQSPDGRVLCTLWPQSFDEAQRFATDNHYRLVVIDHGQSPAG